MALLRGGYKAVALALQEAAELSAEDTRKCLNCAISDQFRDSGSWGHYVDHFGDNQNGDVIYSTDGDMMRAPYEIDADGRAKIDFEGAHGVVPRVSYEIEPDEGDHIAAMAESLIAQKLYTELPVYERFISKSERDAAGSGDFAGKGKSFPILKPGDIMAAVHSMGRAGSDNSSAATLKSRIISIAKKKGWSKYLPKAWRGNATDSNEARRDAFCKATSLQEALNSLHGAPEPPSLRKLGTALFESSLDANTRRDMLGLLFSASDGTISLESGTSASGQRSNYDNLSQRESQESRSQGQGRSGVSRESSHKHSSIKLTESAATTEVIKLQEARADYEIKLIAPGKGSSAFYPSEVLKRDGPKVFTAGTHVYLNHPTAAEEAQRPEGDVSNLAGVLTTTAVYHENHAKGPGLYGRMKVFADHAQMVEEKAAHVGMSIRASGIAESGKMRDGVPVLKELTGAESVDVVTRAGAGGMILTEAARSANPNTGGAAEMDAAEVNKLIETAVKAAQAPLLERAIRGDAREAASKILSGVTLHESAKAMIVETVLRDIPTKDGALDETKFAEAVNAEAKRVGAVIAAATGSGRVTGMGAAPVELSEADQKKLTERAKADEEEAINIFEALGMPADAAKFAAKGRAA